MVAAAIARSHREAGFDVSGQQGVTSAVLDELTEDDSLGATRALPLDLDCYLAIRKVAKEQRSGRGGHEERVSNARRRGTLDVAMIGLMRDARLRVNEAAALTWGDVERVPGGSGRVRVGDTDYRVVSADTMKLLSLVRRGAGDNEPLLGMRPKQIPIRIGAAAKQAGLGEGYSGESPRLGMIQDLETLGVLLLGHRGGLEPKLAFMFWQGGRAGILGTSKPTSIYSSCHITPIPLPYSQLTRRHIRCAKLHRSCVSEISPTCTALPHHRGP